ncbi:MAG: hypothetical protein JO125_12980 [Chloroflexi bacterium]|nr:hypothetical protein [Chloroflexota bacterium]
MSREYTGTSKKRRARMQRNKPSLVTSTGDTQNEQATQDTAVSVEEATSPVVPQQKPKRPMFFSTLTGKRETSGQEVKETEATQARLARATRGKGIAAKTNNTADKATTTKASQAAPGRSTPSRPASPFKTRYIIGMGIYLLGANFLGGLEKQLLLSYNLEKEVFPPFNLFGGHVIITTSTLLFLATLILILVLLARFDLIPRSLSAVAGSPSQNRATTSRTQETNSGERTPPPTIRQGVKGADDQLYEQYRLNQRRERKK